MVQVVNDHPRLVRPIELLQQPPPFSSPVLSEPNSFFTPSKMLRQELKNRLLYPVPEKKTIPALKNLSWHLRVLHRIPVAWSSAVVTQDHIYSLSSYYLAFLKPIPILFNRLNTDSEHAQGPGVQVLKCDLLPSLPGLTIVHFPADPQVYQCDPPVAIFLDSFQLPEHISEFIHSAILQDIIESVWVLKPNARLIISDLSSVVIVHPPDKDGVPYECLRLKSNPEYHRVIIAAYLLLSLTRQDDPVSGSYFSMPVDFIEMPIPLGAPLPDTVPMLPDDFVFSEFHKHSDFDYYMLVNDPRRAEQFLRWKMHQFDSQPLDIAHHRQILPAVTRGLEKSLQEFRPLYTEPIPTRTKQYLREITRPTTIPEPLTRRLESSTSFSVVILDDMTLPCNLRQICRSYTCALDTIDDQPLDSDSQMKFFLRLFDDRFVDFIEPDESFHWGLWWLRWITAEDFARREDAAYKHLFKLPDGTTVYGCLTEYIDAPQLSETVIHSLSDDHKKGLIRSCREAVRILQNSHVSSPSTWNPSTILCRKDETSALGVSCVLTDFSEASLHIDPDPWRFFMIDDFGWCLRHVLTDHSKFGFPSEEFVESVFGRREDWDCFRISSKEGELTRPLDPWEHIYLQLCNVEDAGK
ncbi:hypothetical protein D9756_004860 [Leucocoprinus leucothites]|uniref:Uncharacterized protein n=1 Tax=Leucocoprinus leucothites TaxID=201217 RepID=A0A8H5G9A8_9AGAR|nr:hypothetical protein D9756_004860 [Leucoagaricus leucothites]